MAIVNGTNASETLNLSDGVTNGNDEIFGHGGADWIYGFSGNDKLTGGTGADYLNGGNGADWAIYSDSSVGVRINLSTGTGDGGTAEGDSLTGIEYVGGSKHDDILTGDSDANFLSGQLGSDLLIGGAGDDRLSGGRQQDGNDTLKGGGGADALGGGTGIDTASYDESPKGVVVALNTGAAHYGDAEGDTLGSIENLTGSDFADTLFGDGGVNVLRGRGGKDELKGYGAADTLYGGSAADSLYGSGGNDTLNGDAGDDKLQGGTGVDSMAGGAGNDWVYVDEAGDSVTEATGGGTDRVLSTVDYTLGAAAEVEYLLTTNADGTDAIDFTGNGFDNDIRGNDGVNTLRGKAGNDMLVGHGDNDSFFFNTTLNAATNFDEIADFAPNSDVILLDNDVFTTLGGPGALDPGRFRIGSEAADGNDRIIHNQATGVLFYDADGTGATDKIRFAYLDAGLALDSTDFLVAA